MFYNSKTKSSIITIALLSAALTGCAQPKSALKNTTVEQRSAVENNATKQKSSMTEMHSELAAPVNQDSESRRLQQCQQELEALKTISPAAYAQQKREFDRIMSGAAQYAGIRQDVNNETQGAVDALYRYKAARVCATISQSVLNALSQRGEESK